MNKKIWWAILTIVVLIAIIAFALNSYTNSQINKSNGDATAIVDVVTKFGDNLKMVSVLASADTVSADMGTYYSSYVDPDLLTSWKTHPETAPGKTVSSPVPDHITILSVTPNVDGSYRVEATVIETAQNKDVASTSVTIMLKKENNTWFITSFTGYPSQSMTQAGVTCNQNSQYVAISRNVPDSVGSDIVIKRKASLEQVIPCVYSVDPNDFEIKNEDADYFLQFTNNFIVLDNGTGPGVRGLVVYDLNSKKKVYSDSYSKPLTAEGDTITYWTPTDETPTDENCPTLATTTQESLVPIIESQISVNLQTLKMEDLGNIQCIAKQ